MDKQAKRLTKAIRKQKKPYRSPQLTEYGSVRELTSGGGGGVGDTFYTKYTF